MLWRHWLYMHNYLNKVNMQETHNTDNWTVGLERNIMESYCG